MARPLAPASSTAARAVAENLGTAGKAEASKKASSTLARDQLELKGDAATLNLSGVKEFSALDGAFSTNLSASSQAMALKTWPKWLTEGAKILFQDVVGAIPLVGTATDLGWAAYYIVGGEYFTAATFLVSMIPGVGDVLGPALRKMALVGKLSPAAAKLLGKHSDDIIKGTEASIEAVATWLTKNGHLGKAKKVRDAASKVMLQIKQLCGVIPAKYTSLVNRSSRLTKEAKAFSSANGSKAFEMKVQEQGMSMFKSATAGNMSKNWKVVRHASPKIMEAREMSNGLRTLYTIIDDEMVILAKFKKPGKGDTQDWLIQEAEKQLRTYLKK